MPKKVYTLDAGIGRSNTPVVMNDAAISGGMAFLVSELEKIDPSLRQPLTSFNYPRDIVIESGGGWVESTSVMNVGYGVAGGQEDGAGGIQNQVRIIQANVGKDVYKVIPYECAMQVKFVDVQRGNVTGRSLEQIYDDGIRLDFDKYMDLNTYQGQSKFGFTGLINSASVVAAAAANGAAGTATWLTKTPDEILYDVNDAIVDAWAAAQYDPSAIPNHILVDPANYSYIATTKVSTQAEKTILEFLLANNIAKQKGTDLFIGESRFCLGAGTGSTNRMVVYRNEKRFVSMDVPVSLGRVMTQPNVTNASYDSLYAANVGQVKIHYLEPFRYVDGI
jgi:hypothetical protein